jgi:putative NIF3 family GTP cyclohydrolase 1 type 2
MKTPSLLSRFHKKFPKSRLEAFPEDEWGIEIPNSLKQIAGIGYATSISPQVIRDAKANHLDLIVTLHGAWDFLHEIQKECKYMLRESGMGHIFVHEPMGKTEFSPGKLLLEKAGCSINEELSKRFHGKIGEVDLEKDFDQVKLSLNQALGEDPRFEWNGSKRVCRVATVTGAGANTNYVKSALDLNCDTYITGEYNLYLGMYIQGMGMNCLVYSHTATENMGPQRLAEYLAQSEAPVLKLNEEQL